MTTLFVPAPPNGAAGTTLEIGEPERPFVLRAELGTGVGSSAIGLDRAAPGKIRIVEFRRVGSRLVLVELNKRFLASGDAAGRRGGAESFLQSVIWSAEIADETDSALRVDASSLALTDLHGIAAALRDSGQGDYRLDAARSFARVQEWRVTSSGARLASTLTFQGEPKSGSLRTLAPDPTALSFIQYVQLRALPEEAMQPRRYHPASGGYGIAHRDFSDGLWGDPEVLFQPRFRLDVAPSGVVRRPITFYVDPAIPEPVRTAIVEGGNWWQEGFERAGLRDAFRVEVLPEGDDPHDPDKNVVWWVHRVGRGWSYGAALTDPRTGEILTGRVRLGSQRVEQVRALAEALLAPYGASDESERRAAVEQVVLARMRHLSAHEIGHALGFMHNFASLHHPKPSVMDYPHPKIRLGEDGSYDVSQAYSSGLGPWDEFLVRHAYGTFDQKAEEAALRRLRAEARSEGLIYIADGDAQAPTASHPDAMSWVTDHDPLAALRELLGVRKVALERFSRGVVPRGRQAGELEDRLVLLYLLHRHELGAVSRLIGGVRYEYQLAGDDGKEVRPVDGKEQIVALEQLCGLLSAEHLAIPQKALALLSPPAIRFSRSADSLETNSGPVFDPISAARVASALVCERLFEPARLNRVAWQHATDTAVPTAGVIADRLFDATWRRTTGREGTDRVLLDAAAWTVLHAALSTVGAVGLHDAVRAEIAAALRRLGADLHAQGDAGPPDDVEASALIERVLAGTKSEPLAWPVTIPPGAPW